MNFLLLNLAVADMMVALFIVPRFILVHFFTHPDGMTGTLFCKLLTGGNLTWIGGAASIFILVAIAFERYYAVMYPYGNKGKLTYNKLKVCGVDIRRLVITVQLRTQMVTSGSTYSGAPAKEELLDGHSVVLRDKGITLI